MTTTDEKLDEIIIRDEKWQKRRRKAKKNEGRNDLFILVLSIVGALAIGIAIGIFYGETLALNAVQQELIMKALNITMPI